MRKMLSSPEVISAIVTVLGTLLVGIILGVAEGKIGFASLLAVVAALALVLLVYLLYRRSGPKATALAGLVMLVVGFAGFTLLRPRTPGKPPSPTPEPTRPVAAVATNTAVPQPTKVVEVTKAAEPPAAPTPLPTVKAATSKPTVAVAAATRTLAPAPTAAAAQGTVAVADSLIGVVVPPGPEPAAMVVVDGELWVADDSSHRLYRLDAAGAAAQEITLTQTDIQGLTWDGRHLLLAAGNYGKPSLTVFTTDGQTVETVALPITPRGLCWNEADSTLWTAVYDQGVGFLVHFTGQAGLIETINVDVFGGPDGLACGADGLWVTNPFADVSRYSYEGVKLAQTSADAATGSLPQVSPALDQAGHLYLVSKNGRKIFQFTTRQEAVSSYPTPAWKQRDTTPLARPVIRPLTNAAQTMVSITNYLAVPLTVSLDKENPTEHYATVLLQGQGYSAIVQPGIYAVFASTSGLGMVMYSSRELLVKGYAFSWTVGPTQ